MTALIAYLLRQYEAYQALPAPVRAWLIRAGHGVVQFGGVIATTMMVLDVSFWDALWPALASIITGQAALKQQVPRDPAKYTERAGEQAAEG